MSPARNARSPTETDAREEGAEAVNGRFMGCGGVARRAGEEHAAAGQTFLKKRGLPDV